MDVRRGVGNVRIESRRDNIGLRARYRSHTRFRQVMKKLSSYITYYYRCLMRLFNVRPSRAAEAQ